MENQKKRAERNRTLSVAPDEIPGLETFIGEINNLGENFKFDSIINADLLECLDLIPNKIFNLIVIDPPYNLGKNFNGKKFSAMSDDEYEEFLRSWFYKVCDKLTDDGSLYMCGDWRCCASMQRVISERLTIINRITWQREKGRGAMCNWKNGMEDIWFGVKDPRHYWFDLESVKLKRRVLAPYRENGLPKDWEDTPDGQYRMTCPSNFWDDISVPFWSMPENTDHPAQKPEKLMAKLILASCPPGGVVFDPFAGSGSACVTAKKLGRHYVGVEIDREYCLVAAKRLKMADTDKHIQGYSDGCFRERNST